MNTDDLINELRDRREYYYNIGHALRDAANLLKENWLALQRQIGETEKEET